MNDKERIKVKRKKERKNEGKCMNEMRNIKRMTIENESEM